MEIVNELKKDSLKRILAQGKRADGRQMLDYRKATLQQNAIPNAEGSALCHLGNTQVLAGIKFDVATPFADRPTEGVLSTNAELVPLASSTFEPGPPSPASIELARVVDRGIRSSNCIDLKSFALEEGKVLALYIDLYVLDYDGNLFDAASLAAMSALLCTRMPKIEEGKLIRKESTGKLPLSTKTVTCTFAKVDSTKLLDPSLDEEQGMDGRITIATTPQHVCAVQKGGWGAFTQKDILELVDISFDKAKGLRSILQ
ncbi:exosome complex protein Rrp42 [Candidatus Micrarchaeota archaeon]|nr:exosome complex protein Rrp42 [Candidatus Micrarchaeota archaeon]